MPHPATRPVSRPLLLLGLAALAAIAGLARPAAAGEPLRADQLLLIANRNVPESRALAEQYRQARGVPEGRILELDVPEGERISRADYLRAVAAPAARFIEDNGLRDTVRCAVTFWGVPLVVEAKQLTAAESAELRQIGAQAGELAERFAPLVMEAENVARQAGYRPAAMRREEAKDLETLLARLGAVEQFLQQRQAALTPEQREKLVAGVAAVRARLERPLSGGEGTADAALVADLLKRRDDRQARADLRAHLRGRAPLRDYAGALLAQQRLLSDDQSEACLDSELATLWLADAPAARWLANPLARPAPGAPGAAGRSVLMVARLDGASPQQVRDLIAAGLLAEREGLSGSIVIDSRGIAPRNPEGAADGYGVFDEQLRGLAAFLREHAKLPVVHDDGPEVIAAGEGGRGVAVYVGWYSLAKYVPAFEFARGAVGYHVASLEMRTLRARTGWVRGLLDDGVVATLGPVSEPYLTAFPPPEQFVPLLLTGELTLAEVYWQTVPVMSWKLGLIGDPLYRPFAARPALAVDALPAALRQRLLGR